MINASAEARLREALVTILDIVEDARADENVDCMTDAGGYLCGDLMSEAVEAANEALSTHPPASDFDKQGETGMNWQVSDETLRRIEEINENRRNAAINANSIITGSPSDRTADVTVDDLAVVLANARRAAHGSAPMTKEEAGYVHLWPDGSELKTQARALLDAFTVGRR